MMEEHKQKIEIKEVKNSSRMGSSFQDEKV